MTYGFCVGHHHFLAMKLVLTQRSLCHDVDSVAVRPQCCAVPSLVPSHPFIPSPPAGEPCKQSLQNTFLPAFQHPLAGVLSCPLALSLWIVHMNGCVIMHFVALVCIWLLHFMQYFRANPQCNTLQYFISF